MADSNVAQVRKQADIDLIWKHTHKDNKSVINGCKTVRYPAPYFCSGSIKAMPEACYQQKLKYAKKSELCAIRDAALRPIMKKHGLLNRFESTNQWRDSIDDVKTFAGFALGNDTDELNALLADVADAKVVFPNQ